MAELADAGDLKSPGRKAVWVQVPLPAPSLSSQDAEGYHGGSEPLLREHIPGMKAMNRSLAGRVSKARSLLFLLQL